MTIEDEAIPLAAQPLLPQAGDLVTIEDEMIPLGKLPVSGGQAAEAACGLGILALAAGVLVLRQSKK